MGKNTKIATCCYCGTRAALVLTGKDRHELSCSGCGAPLHNMKKLRSDTKRDRGHPPEWFRPNDGKPYDRAHEDHYRRKRRKKRRKPLLKKALSELLDVVEDIFD